MLHGKPHLMGLGTVADWLLAILTAARTGEVIGARWSEIDMAAAVWTVPADRMKAGKEHRVPLSERRWTCCARWRSSAPIPKPTASSSSGGKAGKPLSSMALLMLLRRMGRGDLTAHGFRSTFRDWCAEATNYPREVAEARAGAHAARQDRGRLSARRPDGKAAPADGGMGSVLRAAGRDRRGRAAAAGA